MIVQRGCQTTRPKPFFFKHMKITVNGAAKELPDALPLAALLEMLALEPGRVAVELNRRIVRKADWPSTVLRPDDSVEVVTFVGGGSH